MIQKTPGWIKSLFKINMNEIMRQRSPSTMLKSVNRANSSIDLIRSMPLYSASNGDIKSNDTFHLSGCLHLLKRRESHKEKCINENHHATKTLYKLIKNKIQQKNVSKLKQNKLDELVIEWKEVHLKILFYLLEH